MNQMQAIISDIKNVQNLNIVTFSINTIPLSMMSLDLEQTLQVGSEVILSCKPTSIALAKEISGVLSFSNQLEVRILEVQEGALLCVVTLQFQTFTLESVITTASFKRMHLQVGEDVVALIKSSDLFIQRSL